MFRSSTFTRYLLFQIPGLVVAGAISLVAVSYFELTWEYGLAGVSMLVLKDLALYPFMKHAFNNERHVGVETLVGVSGTVSKPLSPRGYVKVKGSLWRAETDAGQGPVAEGETVVVQSVDGLTLHVARDPS